MKKPIFEFKNLVYNKNNMNILNIKKFEVHRSACYLFNGNMASGKTLLLDILSKNNKNYSGDIKYEGNDFSELNISYLSKDVKYVKPDFLLKSLNNQKCFISAKVSISERWKQADLEAIKYIKNYPNAICVLIMNDNKEYKGIKSKIKDLDLDDVILANSNDLNNLITSIKST